MGSQVTSTAVSASDLRLVTQMAINNYRTLALNSDEQLYCPIQIMKDKGSNSFFYPYFERAFSVDQGGIFGDYGCVGPTNAELDPYFSRIFNGDPTIFFRECDYAIVANEDFNGTSQNLHIDKLIHRDVVQRVRVNAHRAPMILAGWGFDLGDRPVPSNGPSFPDCWQFDREAASNRAKWKTGPLAVAWDEERQVWAGGPQIVCGIVVKEGTGAKDDGDIKAPKSPCSPTTFVVQLLRKTSNDGGPAEPNVPSDITTKLDKETGSRDRIVVHNRDPSLEQEFMENAMFVIAIRLNYEWLPLWVGCPEDDIKGPKATCII